MSEWPIKIEKEAVNMFFITSKYVLSSYISTIGSLRDDARCLIKAVIDFKLLGPIDVDEVELTVKMIKDNLSDEANLSQLVCYRLIDSVI